MGTREGQRISRRPRGIPTRHLLIGLAVGASALGAACAERPETSHAESESGPDAVLVLIEEDDFSIAPDTIRVPAGRPVRLIVRNRGRVPHEFMAGREVSDGRLVDDLFARAEIHDRSIGPGKGGGVVDPTVMEEGHTAMSMAEDEPGHGVMLALEPRDSATLVFTLPTASRGSWVAACLLPGHYEAGMRAVIVVE